MNTNETITSDFTMDPNLLVSVIKSQAGTLSKALLEGIMNSLDAGAARVDVTLTETSFIIEDGGRGFASADEIRNWFGRFGTPHVEGDATYGRFRMGRGQMMSFASTVWQSNQFCMTVDIEKRGLSYDLYTLAQPFKGCRVEGTLYKNLATYQMRDTLTELRKFVLYTPKPVYVNGELFGNAPARLKTWTHEDENAFYKVVPGSEELHVYNQGVFVEDMSTWRTGCGGVIVSKKPLQVNFARNAILEDKCPVWGAIKEELEGAVMRKLSEAKSLSEGERRYLARRSSSTGGKYTELLMKAKVLTDPSGKHLPLSALRGFNKFTFVEETGALACAIHGIDRTFVVTENLLTRFGVGDIYEFVREMHGIAGVLPFPVEIIEARSLADRGIGGVENLGTEVLSGKQMAAFRTLEWLNVKVAAALMAAGITRQPRQLLLGKHKRNAFVAWTDGATYITANRAHLKLFDKGLDGVLEWAQTLVHEYMHDTDDSESHSHAEVFYQKFHDAMFAGSCLQLATHAQEGLVEYLNQLNLNGQPRSRELIRQLRPRIELRTTTPGTALAARAETEDGPGIPAMALFEM